MMAPSDYGNLLIATGN